MSPQHLAVSDRLVVNNGGGSPRRRLATQRFAFCLLLVGGCRPSPALISAIKGAHGRGVA